MGEQQFSWNMFSLKISRVFLTERRRRHWNYEVARKIGASDQTTHAVLKRFIQRGWIEGERERTFTSPRHDFSRSPRVLYSLTEIGAQAMGDALRALQLAST